MEKLRKWMDEKGMKYRHFAEMAGFSKSYFSQILTGKKKPSLAGAVRIEKLTEGAVKCSDWVEEE